MSKSDEKGSQGWHDRLVYWGVFLLIAGLGASLSTGKWHWFSRAGSGIVVCGIILTGEQLLASHRRFHASNTDDEATPEEIEEQTEPVLYNDKKERWLGEMFGFYMLIVGTVIWGFGDLIELIPAVAAKR